MLLNIIGTWYDSLIFQVNCGFKIPPLSVLSGEPPRSPNNEPVLAVGCGALTSPPKSGGVRVVGGTLGNRRAYPGRFGERFHGPPTTAISALVPDRSPPGRSGNVRRGPKGNSQPVGGWGRPLQAGRLRSGSRRRCAPSESFRKSHAELTLQETAPEHTRMEPPQKLAGYRGQVVCLHSR